MLDSQRGQDHAAPIGGRGVGASLRAAREAGGETIFDAAARVRIRAEYLFALEEEDFQSLPGWAYALSYVRTYAEYLGLEATPIVKRVREQYELRQHMLVEAAAVADARPRRRLAGLFAILCALVAGGWYATSPGIGFAEIFEPIPRGFKALIDRSFFTVAEGESPAAVKQAVARSVADGRDGDEAVPPPTAEVPIAGGESARFGALRDEPGNDGKVVIAGSASTHAADAGRDIVFRARESVWLTVENDIGGVLLAQQLRKGELYRLPAGSGIAISADNAGAVEYYVDGRLAGTLGPDGRQVSRLPIGRLTEGGAGG